MKRLAAGALAVTLVCALWAAPALACSVCYGEKASDSPMITSARLGVFLLLGITFTILGGFARFFFILRNRAQKFESDSIAMEWTQLQRSASS